MRRHQHYTPPAPQAPGLFDSEQAAHISRVTSQIARAILTFCRSRLATGQSEFHADDLRAWVSVREATAPGSADRILRDLRRAGVVDYRVVNRAQSLYRVVSVA